MLDQLSARGAYIEHGPVSLRYWNAMAFRKLDEQSLPTHRARILALEESTPARWGGMNAAAMVCHLRAILELSLGETKVPLVVSPIIGKPIGLLFFYVFTRFPKGRKGSAPPIPALCPLPTLSFQEERQRLLAALERFVARQESDPREKVPHPFLGATTLARWARVHEVHFRHHYRQFGVG